MNIKIFVSISFILLLVFSTIGCLMYDVFPKTETTLTEEYQVQKFEVTPTFNHVTWSLNDEIVLVEHLNEHSRFNTSYTLDWNDLSNGHYILKVSDQCSKVVFHINVVKPEEIQDKIENAGEQFSWNDTRSEWKEKSDELMNSEEI